MALFDDMEQEQNLADNMEPAATLKTENTGFPLPQHNMICLGHERIESNLLKRFQADKFPHALIFTGPKGIGKATFAYRLARFLLTQPAQGGLFGGDDRSNQSEALKGFDVDADHPSIRRMHSGGHADIRIFRRVYDEKRKKLSNDIPVDEVRKIAPFLNKTAAEGGWRIVIVDEAEHMKRAGQNAILKILEEPPPQTLLILITDQVGRFLPTIRSRCQVFDFNLLNEEDMQTLLYKMAPDLSGEDRKVITKLAEGQMGYAQELIEKNGLEIYQEMLEFLNHMPHVDEVYAYKFSESLASDDERQGLFVRMLMDWLRKMALYTARNMLPPPINTEEQKSLIRLESIYNNRDWLEIYDKVQNLVNDMERLNLDSKQSLLEVIWAFEKE